MKRATRSNSVQVRLTREEYRAMRKAMAHAERGVPMNRRMTESDFVRQSIEEYADKVVGQTEMRTDEGTIGLESDGDVDDELLRHCNDDGE